MCFYIRCLSYVSDRLASYNIFKFKEVFIWFFLGRDDHLTAVLSDIVVSITTR